MRRDMIEIDADWQQRTWDPQLCLHDVEAIRLLLSGGSVVDWQRLQFSNLDQVNNYLAIQCLDMENQAHRDRLRYVFNEAVSYLEEHLKLHFPRELRAPADVREVFLWASAPGGFRRTQILSCVILKLMHVIHHLAAADLRHRTSVSEAELLAMAHHRILSSARQMQIDGVPILSFAGNRKSRSSIITKLISKRDNLAATVFDKLRYRCVVDTHEHLPAALAWMSGHMFPFNYILPGQSHNNLLDPDSLTELLCPEERGRIQDLAQPPTIAPDAKNEFSGASYRIINFIADYPVPLPEERHPFDIERGHTVFINVEIQVLDEETARNNELGENAHHFYKQRQEQVVSQRLKRGRQPRKIKP